MMNGFEREGDTVEANCIPNLLNGWVGAIIQASRDRIYGTSQFYAIEMYADHPGTNRLRATVESPELAPGGKSVDAVATRSVDGTKLYREKNVSLRVEITSVPHARAAEIETLRASTPAQRNSFSNPGTLVPSKQSIVCAERCNFELPSDSVAVLTVDRRETAE